MATINAHGRSHAFVGHLVSARKRARRRILANLLTAREDERRRIARDLTGQPLRSMAAIGARLEELRMQLEGPGVRSDLERLRRDVEMVSERLRRLATGLVFLPESGDLEVTLESYLAGVEFETGIRCTLHFDLEDEPDDETAGALLRIAQEAVANACRHAGDARVTVTVLDAEGILLRVEDDGCGFDTGEVGSSPDRTGLAVMRQRAESIGGRLTVDSTAGKGTVVEAYVPSFDRTPGPPGLTVISGG